MSGLARFWQALKEVPGALYWSIRRYGTQDSARTRSQRILTNVFLHIHSVRTHRFSLKWTFSFGLGVMATASLAILTITGLLLMIYYKPATGLAYDSIKDIVYVVPAGRFVRNLHRWSAHVMVICVFLHMARVFFTGSYKRGREFNWVVGIVLLVLTLMLSFTGYLLPWDQLAYWAVTIGANIAGSVSELTDAVGITEYADVGAFFRRMLLGSDVIGDDALVRFYFLHCILLPAALFGMLTVHFWRIRKDGGLSRPDDITEDELEGIPKDEIAEKSHGQETEKIYSLMGIIRGSSNKVGQGPDNTIPSYPHAFRYELAAVLLVTALVCVLSLIGDAPLKEMANPAVPENPAKAPWYFLGLQELVSYSAFMGGIGIPTIVLIGLGLVPLIDKEPGRIGRWFEDARGKQVAARSLLFALVVCIGMLAFTVNLGWLRNWFPEVPQLVIILVNPGTVIAAVFAAYSLWIIQRTDSIRAGAIAMFVCFLVGFVVLTYFGTIHRGPNWDFYWWPSLWPGH